MADNGRSLSPREAIGAIALVALLAGGAGWAIAARPDAGSARDAAQDAQERAYERAMRLEDFAAACEIAHSAKMAAMAQSDQDSVAWQIREQSCQLKMLEN